MGQHDVDGAKGYEVSELAKDFVAFWFDPTRLTQYYHAEPVFTVRRNASDQLEGVLVKRSVDQIQAGRGEAD